MDAPAESCSFCGEPSDDRHHLTGKGPTRQYLHPELTADLCHRHHELIHDALRHQQIDKPQPGDGWNSLRFVEHTLRRIAVFIAQYAIRADNPVWALIASALVECAERLTETHELIGGAR